MSSPPYVDDLIEMFEDLHQSVKLFEDKYAELISEKKIDLSGVHNNINKMNSYIKSDYKNLWMIERANAKNDRVKSMQHIQYLLQKDRSLDAHIALNETNTTNLRSSIYTDIDAKCGGLWFRQ